MIGTIQCHPFGPDGCFNVTHPANKGITDNLLEQEKYSHISKADFWVVAGNAVIHQTSLGALDLRSNFQWGRKVAASCPGAGTQLLHAMGWASVKAVFVTRMGLSWKDVVVLMGAHMLGWGNIEKRMKIFLNECCDKLENSLVTMEHGKIQKLMLRYNKLFLCQIPTNTYDGLFLMQRFDKQYCDEIFTNSWE
ncbi:LOW QUALITY PROTEIN: hypothetical protein ACHAWU_007021 [Discostella pseudostelligera]|uniref:Plant heme peroxidase family profile domain-containing protein n=1 Tax=Discostella pseudostelligera TaxID=259834 RepID=A0ABD3LZ07_9STRA